MEKIVEKLIWKSRYIIMLAVVFSLLGATILFLIASSKILKIFLFILYEKSKINIDLITSGIIKAIDLYLIAVVLILFAFGLYELFIDEIKWLNKDKLLSITSLDQLKDKIAKVIIMALIVSYFQRVITISYYTPIQMLFLALSITFLSVGLYFLSKIV